MHFNLSKLPVWGSQISSEDGFDFEWPTIADLQGQELPPKLLSIEFKSDRIHQLFSVKCNLTSGLLS